MSKYLISTVETYRVGTEEEATRAIEEAKNDHSYILSKYTSEHKERKLKGEVVDEYWKLSLTKLFKYSESLNKFITSSSVLLVLVAITLANCRILIPSLKVILISSSLK